MTIHEDPGADRACDAIDRSLGGLEARCIGTPEALRSLRSQAELEDHVSLEDGPFLKGGAFLRFSGIRYADGPGTNYELEQEWTVLVRKEES